MAHRFLLIAVLTIGMSAFGVKRTSLIGALMSANDP
jgi:hypothetical protein